MPSSGAVGSAVAAGAPGALMKLLLQPQQGAPWCSALQLCGSVSPCTWSLLVSMVELDVDSKDGWARNARVLLPAWLSSFSMSACMGDWKSPRPLVAAVIWAPAIVEARASSSNRDAHSSDDELSDGDGLAAPSRGELMSE